MLRIHWKSEKRHNLNTLWLIFVTLIILRTTQCDGWQTYRGRCWDSPAAVWICLIDSFHEQSWVELLTRSGLRYEPPGGWWDELGECAVFAVWSKLYNGKIKQPVRWEFTQKIMMLRKSEFTRLNVEKHCAAGIWYNPLNFSCMLALLLAPVSVMW